MAGKGSRNSGRLTLILIIFNLLALAAGLSMQFYHASRPSGLTELNPAKIRFWSQPAAPAAPSPGSALEPARTVVAVPEAAPTASRLCIELSGFDQARYDEMTGLLKAASLGPGQCRYDFDKKLGWWVYWPPEYETARRDKVVKAIQAAGVKDVMAITQGAMAQAFSLGIFASETQASQHRNGLRGKGLEKVQYGPRPGLAEVRLDCVLDAPGRLDGFKAGLPAWAKPVAADTCMSAEKVPAPTPRPR